MKRLLMLIVAVIAAIAAWLTPPAVAAVVSAPATAGVTYNYDRHPHTEPRTYATTERGPPTTAATVTTYNAVDVQAHRLSARPDVIAPQPIYGYDHPAPAVQVVGAASTTAAGASLDSAQFARSSVAAKTGTSALDSLAPAVRSNVDDTISRAASGKVRFPGHDGKVYNNSDGLLPRGGSYTEWTAAEAGAKRGAHRVVIEGDPARPNAIYYWDHVNPPVRIGP